VTALVRPPGQATPGRRPSAWAVSAGLVATVLMALPGMSDRVAAHGGTLTVRSRPGQGTIITGRLPTSELTAARLRPASLGPK